jgi:hypothetical protein
VALIVVGLGAAAIPLELQSRLEESGFSSPHGTMARAGKPTSRPTTSRSVAAKRGALNRLNLRRRYGCKP